MLGSPELPGTGQEEGLIKAAKTVGLGLARSPLCGEVEGPGTFLPSNPLPDIAGDKGCTMSGKSEELQMSKIYSKQQQNSNKEPFLIKGICKRGHPVDCPK